MSDRKGWIGVDLDGTLAIYDGWVGPEHIGDPVPAMVARVKEWIAAGYEVRVFTARCTSPDPLENHNVILAIKDWLEKHGLPRLAVTASKDYAMLELWDDRAVQVEPNTGRPIGQSTRGLT